MSVKPYVYVDVGCLVPLLAIVAAIGMVTRLWGKR